LATCDSQPVCEFPQRDWVTVHLITRTNRLPQLRLLCISCAARVPRRSARCFISTKKPGTRIKAWVVDVIIPPTIGATIGFVTSEPMPLSARIGARLASTAVTVISFGRSRCTAPSIAAASFVIGTPAAILCCRASRR